MERGASTKHLAKDHILVGTTSWPEVYQSDLEPLESAGHVVQSYARAHENLYDLLASTARRSPDAKAVQDDTGQSLSYAELLKQTDHVACALTSCGIGPGRRLGFLLEASVSFVTCLFAAAKLGALIVLLPTKYKAPELERLIQAAQLKHLVVSPALEHLVPPKGLFVYEPQQLLGAQVTCGALQRDNKHHAYNVACGNDPLFMLFTSGTTARSKALILTHANVIHAARTYAHLMHTSPLDSCVIPLPIYHVTSLIALLIQFIAVGARIVLHRRYSAQTLLQTVRDEHISYLHLTPTVYAQLLAYKNVFPELPSLRVLLSGSSYEPVSVMQRYHTWLPHAAFTVVYGMSETASPALLFPGDSATSVFAGATGKVVPGLEACIVREDGTACAPSEAGELMLRGANISPGYADEELLLGDKLWGLNEQGWLATGDIAYANEEGMVWVVDRKKDMINRGGEKIWCSALEDIVSRIEGVQEALVCGISDTTYGEVPVCAVVLRPGVQLTQEQIQKALSTQIAHYKIPVAIRCMPALPLTCAGKPDRRALRALFEGGEEHAPQSACNNT